jgi:O-antigen ligase
LVLVGVVLALSVLGYDKGLYAPYYLSRLAPLYLLVAALLVVWALTLNGRRPLSVDLVDALAVLAVVWLVVGAVASPASAIAWLGYYNRGTGVLFSTFVLALFLTSRRLLRSRASLLVLALLVAVLVSIAGLVALAQALHVHTYWPLPSSWPGRMTGTTGNPINLAGVGLLGLWLALLAGGDGGFAVGRSRRSRVAARVVVAVGAACGVLAIVLSVTRAAYLGVAVALVGALVLLVRRRRTRALVVLGVVLAVLLAGAFVRLAGGSSSGSLAGRLGATHTHAGALDSSDRVRLKLWQEAVAGIGDRPLLGYGAGAFVVADRLHRPRSLRVSEPWKVASDPHSLPLLVGSTTGLPGLLLVGGIVALIGASIGRRVWQAAPPPGSAGAAPESHQSVGVTDETDRWPAAAALVYLGAAGVFLLVSPLDAVTAVPLAVIAGATLGRPVAGSRLTRELCLPARRLGVLVLRVAVIAVTVAALAGVTALAIQYFRADRQMGAYQRNSSVTALEHAAALFPWEPMYPLEAGGHLWRQGVTNSDQAQVSRGAALLHDGISRDPTGGIGYAELERLAIAQGQQAQVAQPARDGLRWNPGHPVLEGLWAYAAVDVLVHHGSPALARSIADAVAALPPASPDAWHWLAAVRGALGDKAGAAVAAAHAKQLAPHISVARYKRRLVSGL